MGIIIWIITIGIKILIDRERCIVNSCSGIVEINKDFSKHD